MTIPLMRKWFKSVVEPAMHERSTRLRDYPAFDQSEPVAGTSGLNLRPQSTSEQPEPIVSTSWLELVPSRRRASRVTKSPSRTRAPKKTTTPKPTVKPANRDITEVLFLGDSWGGNINVELVNEQQDAGFEFLQIPERQTRDLHPLDVTFFGSINTSPGASR